MTKYLFPKTPDNPVYDITLDHIRRLRDENRQDTELGKQMTQSTYRGENFLLEDHGSRDGLYEEILHRDPLTAGMKIEYPHGVIIQQSQRRYLFRGENKQYSRSVSSLLRILDDPDKGYRSRKERELYRLVADMRVGEFIQLLKCFDHVKQWKDSSIIWEALAQHYGLETGWLDITSNFDIALFFATCTYEAGKWRPLTKADTEKNEQSKYGMIFYMPTRVMTSRLSRCLERFSPITSDGTLFTNDNIQSHLFNEQMNLIFPIGFQPFMRCSMQDGYGLYMRTSSPLQEDADVQKLRFRHDEALSEHVFEEMEGGKAIYPHEGLTHVQYVIDKIRSLTTFSEEAFAYALERSHYYRKADERQCREDLSRFSFCKDGQAIPIEITERSPWRITPGKRRMINSLYRDFSIQQIYEIRVMERKADKGPGFFEPWMLLEYKDSPGAIDFKPRSSAGCMSIEITNMIDRLAAIERGFPTDYM